MPAQPTPANFASVAALGVIWGGTFLVVSIALEGYGPLTVAGARTSLGAVALLSLMLVLRRPFPGRAALPWLLPIGVLNTALPFSLLAWGQQAVPSAFAGITMAVLPLFVLPLAHLFSDERMTARNTGGVLIGLAGALVLVGPGLLGMEIGATPLAEMACLAATLSYACASVLTRRCPPVDPISLSAFTLVVGSVALVPVTLTVEGMPGWAGARAGGAILFLGVVPTALAALLRVMVIRTAGSIFMTLVNYQVPLWAMLFGWSLGGEDLPWRFFAALGLILAGLAVSQWAGLRRLLHGRPAEARGRV